MTLQELIAKTIEQDAFELLLSPGTAPRFRKKGLWQVFAKTPMAPGDTRKLVTSLLNQEQLALLNETGQFEGFWHLHGQKLFCQIQASRSGLLAYLSWLPAMLTETQFWNFPRWMANSLSLGRGLHLLIGRHKIHNEAAVCSLVNEINDKDSKMIIWQREDNLSVIQEKQSVISYFKNDRIPDCCDLLICEGKDNLQLAIEQSQQGRSVLLVIQQNGFFEAIQNLAKAGIRELLAGQLQWAATVKVLHGIDGWVPAFDLVAGSEEIRLAIIEGRFSQLESLLDGPMFEEGRNPARAEGQRSMNQTLLQLILKRKIELRQGFEESPDPDNLDQLLKKVGF